MKHLRGAQVQPTPSTDFIKKQPASYCNWGDLIGLSHNSSHKDHLEDHLWMFKRDQQSTSMVLKNLVAMFSHLPSLGM